MEKGNGPEQKERWDSMYTSKPDFFGSDPSDFGVRSAELFARSGIRSVLELGCGQGRDSLYLLSKGFDVTAMDYSSTGCGQLCGCATGRSLDTYLKLTLADARKGLPYEDGAFDAVFSHMFFTMQFTENEIQFILDEVLRVLRPGGLNVYSVRNDHDDHFGKGRYMGEDMWENQLGLVVHFFSEEKIRHMSKGFEVLEIKETIEGSHPFTKILYEVTLRKPN
jgi:SAM-dependent methyltransferase